MKLLRNRMMSGLTVLGFMVVAATVAFYISTYTVPAVAGEGGISIASIDSRQVLQAHPAFHEAMEEYQRKLQEFRRQMEEVGEDEEALMRQMLQQQVQQLGVQLQERAFDAMQEDVEKFAKEKGYDYIIDSEVLLAGGIDVTDAMLEKLGEDPAELEEPEVPGQVPVMP